MRFIKLVEDMRTVRDFKKDKIDNTKLQKVLEFGNNTKGIIKDADISIKFIENGKEIYKQLSGKAGYHGKMIEAPHYIAVLSKLYPYYLENSGYIMEAMRLKAWELGLGSCWLNVEEEEGLRESLNIEKDQVITAFIAIGHPYTGIFKKDTSPKSSRMGIAEMVYLERWGQECTMEYLDERGISNLFYYAKLAPSWGNVQPWRFVIDGEKIYLAIEKEESKKLDAGIMMLYLEKASHGEGIAGNWTLEKLEELEKTYNIPKEYELIGYYSI